MQFCYFHKKHEPIPVETPQMSHAGEDWLQNIHIIGCWDDIRIKFIHIAELIDILIREQKNGASVNGFTQAACEIPLYFDLVVVDIRVQFCLLYTSRCV